MWTIAHGDALLAPSVTLRIIEHLATGPADPSVHRDFEQLTVRAREVLREVATGQPNGEIAETLVVTEAKRQDPRLAHPRQLGLGDRAQFVVAAYESGLVRQSME